MKKLRKKLYITAGFNTLYFGSGRKEFHPKKTMPTFETYLKDTAKGTMSQIAQPAIDEGVISNFMSAKFINQGNLPGFLPFMVPELMNKPCTGVEGACGSGGLALMSAAKSILSGMAETIFVAGFEIQNTMKAVYGADVLAGAAYFNKERKDGHAFFFPGVFSDRAGAYYAKYGEENTRKGMAKWFENAILNARKSSKAQEYHNSIKDLLALGMTRPNGKFFVDHLNLYDCSKVTDGASSLIMASEEGLKSLGVSFDKAVEITGLMSAEGDITQAPDDLTTLNTTAFAVKGAMKMAGITKENLGVMEIHDCFSITGILALEAAGIAKNGEGADFVSSGEIKITGSMPVNPSGGLCGFGHPTGATGIRQAVDLLHQLTGQAENQIKLNKQHSILISMGGNDKTVTCLIIKG